MRLKGKSLFTEPLFFYIILLNYMKPDSFNNVGLPDFFIKVSGLWDKLIGIPVILICVLALLTDTKNKIGDVILYYFYKIATTLLVTYLTLHVITGSGVFAHLRRLSAIWYLALALKYDYKATVKRLTYILTILVVLNFVSILAFPHGMYQDDNWENYFLGYDNGHMVVFMPALFFSAQYAFYSKRRVLMFINWFSVYASALICRSGTTVVGLALLAFLKESTDWQERYPFLEDKGFFFSLATLAKNKNGRWIIETAKNNPDSVFAIAGKKYETEEVTIPPNVHLLGFVSDEDACALIKHCKAFVYPSIYEGFGLPPLEALALGAEVISSNSTSLPEVLGDSVHYIDPYKYNADLRTVLQKQIAHEETALKRYSWEKSVTVLCHVLQEK